MRAGQLGSVRPELVSSDPAWATVFEVERSLIEVALGPLGRVVVEHVGSTAVPGLRAKPIVDILVGVRSFERLGDYRLGLAGLGYVYDADAHWDDVGRHVFRKTRRSGARSHHVHLALLHGRYWTRLIAFRDYLRAEPEVAQEYEALKATLARRYALDGGRYTQGKAAFVRRVETLAGVDGESGDGGP